MKISRRTSLSLFTGLFLSALALFGAPARADEVVVKLGTSAPVGSIWHQLLKEAAQKWDATTGGRVKLRIFAGGTMGNEGDMIKKMRIGQLQAAAVSTIALHEIVRDPKGGGDSAFDPLALDLPFVIQSPEEREYVLSKLGAQFEKALFDRGFVVLNWSEIGFVRFFSTEARPTVADMQKAKIFSWEGDPASTDAWRTAGFQPVVLSSTDIVPSLQTGMINAVAYPPTVVLAARINDKAKFMLDMVLSSLTGSLIIDRKTWERIPEADRSNLLGIARELGKRTVDASRKMEREALDKMKAQGLQVVGGANVDDWRKAWGAATPAIRGKVVPGPVLDQVSKLAAEYRAQHSTKSAK